MKAEAAAKRAFDQQPDGNGNLKAWQVVVEEHPRRANGVDREEAAGDEESERQQEDTSVAASVGCLAGDVREDESPRTHLEEEANMQARTGPLRIDLRPQNQRYEPNERESQRQDPSGRHGDTS